jgi:gamma-glutamyltranspeptidase/glutathione hydrolase
LRRVFNGGHHLGIPFRSKIFNLSGDAEDLSNWPQDANPRFRIENLIKPSCTSKINWRLTVPRRFNLFFGMISMFCCVLGGATVQAVPAQGQKIMIAGPSPYAVDIAREVYSKGGNAIDVAVASLLSLAVTHPYYAALGGGGFAVVKAGNEIRALDFRETAPQKSGPDMFKDRPEGASTNGGLAVAIPGNPAGLWELHHKYGKLKWNQLFDHALRLANQGFRVSGEWAETTARKKERFDDTGKKLFFAADGRPLKPGDLIKQPVLGKFLQRYRTLGPKAFYEGEYAKDIVKTINSHGGVFTSEDLKIYKVRWLDPIVADYAGYKVYLMPPPSSGGVLIKEALILMDKLKLRDYKPLSIDELHLLAEIEKLSYRGRQLLGDPDFIKNPIEQLTGDKYLSGLAAMVKMDQSVAVEPLRQIKFEKEETTHISVLDAEGNAVSLTLTLNGNYGAGVVAPLSGIALNNEMDDFSTKPGQPNMFGLIQGEGDLVRAGARPLSSMSPTLVEKNGKVVLVLGAPGGPRITSAVMQVLHRSLDQTFDIDQAIQAPRVHHQFLPDVVITDHLKLPPETIAALEARGHKIDFGSTAKVYGVRRDDKGILSGAADSRGEGAAGGF